jgi:hypothetical protein
MCGFHLITSKMQGMDNMETQINHDIENKLKIKIVPKLPIPSKSSTN